MTDGSAWLSLSAAVLLVGGLALETVFTHWRWTPWFRLGMPLGLEPLPIDGRSKVDMVHESGGICWDMPDSGLVRFWVKRGSRAAPMLLHGSIELTPSGSLMRLRVIWAPPLTYFLSAAWLAILGGLRGEGALTGVIAAVLLAGVLFVYQRSAVVAARAVRYGLDASR